MSQVAPESMTESPGAMTPTSQHAADPLPFEHPPKLKGRQRILQSLQRISSTPSLAKLGRASPSSYRTGNKASMSCVSLTSPTFSQGHSYGHSYSSQSSAGFSTAPTSVAGTPCTDSFIHDSRVRVRLVNGNDSTGYFPQGLTSVPLPEEVRTAAKDAQVSYPSALMAEQMISIPGAIVKVKQLRKRANFDFWDEMPHEIKVQILSFLSPKQIVRCSMVSKAWRKMCFDGQLWMIINTETFYRQISSASLVKLLTAGGPFIKDLNLRGCVQMEKKWKYEGQKLSNLCQNLENLSLEGCRIDESTIHFFLLRNSRLVHINVSGLLEINNSTMEIIARCCPQLQHLNVSWCRKVTTSGLHKVVQSCPKLTDLRAGEIKGFDDPIFLLSLFETNRLERLVVCRCDDLDDESLKLLIQGRDPEIDPLTDRPMVPPRALRHIDFSRCDNLTDIGIQSLAHNVPHLCGLQLTLLAVTDASLTTLLPTIPNLTHLDLEELEDLTNVTLQNLATSPCALRLQHLNASYCESFSDTGMLPLIKACPSLHSLIMDNTRISDLSLVEAAAQLRLRDRACPTLPPAAQKPEITLTLVAYDCANVTWTGVREILSRNAEPHRRSIISLKCFYGYQDTVNEHTKRVLKGDCRAAERLERKWGDYMVASEEAGATGAGARRRRRRARDAAMVHADEEEGGPRGGRRRARSGGCAVM
ncbi:hypothetical protein G7Y79_00009g026700 [Physcia stellaris]|nr:hypothetical protein G7Y79_00009g026700 [Physcia stellaris]